MILLQIAIFVKLEMRMNRKRRIGEIIGLTWEDCDFTENIISINHNLIYRQQDDGKCEMHITTPKTEAGKRIVPMFEAVRKVLLQERRQQRARLRKC